jgi:hypothetical protein
MGKASVFNGIYMSYGEKFQQRDIIFTANGVTWLFNHGQVEVGLLLRHAKPVGFGRDE